VFLLNVLTFYGRNIFLAHVPRWRVFEPQLDFTKIPKISATFNDQDTVISFSTKEWFMGIVSIPRRSGSKSRDIVEVIVTSQYDVASVFVDARVSYASM
jgi:hypothetical protein